MAMNTLTADALRIAIQGLDEAIRSVRVCSKTGDRRLAEFSAEYRRLVRWVAQLQDKHKAESSITQPLCMSFLPLPINPQVMDTDQARKFRREWAEINQSSPRAAQQRAA